MNLLGEKKASKISRNFLKEPSPPGSQIFTSFTSMPDKSLERDELCELHRGAERNSLQPLFAIAMSSLLYLLVMTLRLQTGPSLSDMKLK